MLRAIHYQLVVLDYDHVLRTVVVLHCSQVPMKYVSSLKLSAWITLSLVVEATHVPSRFVHDNGWYALLALRAHSIGSMQLSWNLQDSRGFFAFVQGPGRPYFSLILCPRSRLHRCKMLLLFTIGDRTEAYYVLATVSYQYPATCYTVSDYEQPYCWTYPIIPKRRGH